ncbi:MAG: hypothetical protein JXR96_28655, partial [Deltaproteobacteria bacterium]|nr:hypothetical protein [Deltaproteobacteria bacterium]
MIIESTPLILAAPFSGRFEMQSLESIACKKQGASERSALFASALAVRVCASHEKKIPHDLAG